MYETATLSNLWTSNSMAKHFFKSKEMHAPYKLAIKAM